MKVGLVAKRLTLLICLLLFSLEVAFAGPIPPVQITVCPNEFGQIIPPPPTIKYVKFLCGDLNPVLVGSHFTAINVLNPHTKPLPPGSTWEAIVDFPDAVAPGPQPLTVPAFTPRELTCTNISAVVSVVTGTAAQNIKGYVIIQIPCAPVGTATGDPPCQKFECFDVVIDTVYEHALPPSFVNKVLFKLNRTVSPALPAGKPLEVIIPANPIGAPLNVEDEVRELLNIPNNVRIAILDVDIAPLASGLSLDVERNVRQ